MSQCKLDRRRTSRRSTDVINKWSQVVAMSVLFAGWASLVYLHALISP
jgi:hypothetical protein